MTDAKRWTKIASLCVPNQPPQTSSQPREPPPNHRLHERRRHAISPWLPIPCVLGLPFDPSSSRDTCRRTRRHVPSSMCRNRSWRASTGGLRLSVTVSAADNTCMPKISFHPSGRAAVPRRSDTGSFGRRRCTRSNSARQDLSVENYNHQAGTSTANSSKKPQKDTKPIISHAATDFGIGVVTSLPQVYQPITGHGAKNQPKWQEDQQQPREQPSQSQDQAQLPARPTQTCAECNDVALKSSSKTANPLVHRHLAFGLGGITGGGLALASARRSRRLAWEVSDLKGRGTMAAGIFRLE